MITRYEYMIEERTEVSVMKKPGIQNTMKITFMHSSLHPQNYIHTLPWHNSMAIKKMLFGRILAQELICNELDQEISQKQTRAMSNWCKCFKHSLQSNPSYLKFINGKWKKVCKRKCQQKFCSTLKCKMRTWYYYLCNP